MNFMNLRCEKTLNRYIFFFANSGEGLWSVVPLTNFLDQSL